MGRLRERLFPTLAAEERSRRLTVVQVAVTLLVVGSSVLDVLDMPGQGLLMGTVTLLAILVTMAGYLLARLGRYHLGAALLTLSMLPLYSLFVLLYGSRSMVPYIYLWPIMTAAILLEPPLIFSSAALVSLLYGAISAIELYQVWPIPFHLPDLFADWHRPADPVMVELFYTDMATVILGYFAVAFFAWLGSRNLLQALERSREQADELEQYSVELEQRVADRTAQLSQALESLQASMGIIREAGSPVLPILEGVILTPLIGALDSERVSLVMQQVLQGAAEHRARVVILDITGVPVVDTAVANALIQTARGVRLLGATPVLVGIRSEVAQTIVDLGVDLRGIVTRSSLQDGLAYALEELGTLALTGADAARAKAALAGIRPTKE